MVGPVRVECKMKYFDVDDFVCDLNCSFISDLIFSKTHRFNPERKGEDLASINKIHIFTHKKKSKAKQKKQQESSLYILKKNVGDKHVHKIDESE